MKRRDHGAQFGRRLVEHGLQEGHGGTQRPGARGAIGVAHGGVEGQHRHEFEGAGRQQRAQGLAALLAHWRKASAPSPSASCQRNIGLPRGAATAPIR
jgi:hypothetical protein